MKRIGSDTVRFVLLLILPVLLLALASGCSTTSDPENESQRPWGASPQGFNSGLPSSMTEGR
ncbi:MAG: hypothetical protein MUC91_09850 [Verrucomicrobia bacterium]|jgi:hypothetical protein|nr:hypothetical protein [Verrucomicrobiota bacterium]